MDEDELVIDRLHTDEVLDLLFYEEEWDRWVSQGGRGLVILEWRTKEDEAAG